ncbi:hypothetical protein FB446DRAFT_759643 [Lentinula raphanica]|nr:hypothetical protein FB446DRAFT_759643 [Lentinula raphanica]
MTASSGPVTLHPNGKGKARAKPKGASESARGGTKSRSKNGKARRKKRRRSSSPENDDEEGESEEESADTASSNEEEEEDVDEASAVNNLLSLRANSSGLKGTPTLVTPLHHNLSSYTHTMTSMGTMSSSSTIVGSVSGWGYPSSSTSFVSNGNSITGSKPYYSHFQTPFMDKNYSHVFHGVNPVSQFSLSKAYPSGTTPYESSAVTNGNTGGDGSDTNEMHNGGYHRDGLGHVQNMVSDVRSADRRVNDSEQLGSFQSNMAMSSLRSTSSASRNANGSGVTGGPELAKGSMGTGTRSHSPMSRPNSEAREDRDRVRNLDPELVAMDLQSKYAGINRKSDSPRTSDPDTVNKDSNSKSTATPISILTAAPASLGIVNGSQNGEQRQSDFKDSDQLSTTRPMSESPLETNGSAEARMMLRPVENKKDWEM